MGTTAATLVTGWYSARGVTPRYRADMVESLEPIGSPPSDAERSLMWLRQHVAPTVRTLLQWYTRSELEEALFAPAGLLSIVTPIVTPRGSEPALTE
jgi:hypothetical protein